MIPRDSTRMDRPGDPRTPDLRRQPRAAEGGLPAKKGSPRRARRIPLGRQCRAGPRCRSVRGPRTCPSLPGQIIGRSPSRWQAPRNDCARLPFKRGAHSYEWSRPSSVSSRHSYEWRRLPNEWGRLPYEWSGHSYRSRTLPFKRAAHSYDSGLLLYDWSVRPNTSGRDSCD